MILAASTHKNAGPNSCPSNSLTSEFDQPTDELKITSTQGPSGLLFWSIREKMVVSGLSPERPRRSPFWKKSGLFWKWGLVPPILNNGWIFRSWSHESKHGILVHSVYINQMQSNEQQDAVWITVLVAPSSKLQRAVVSINFEVSDNDEWDDVDSFIRGAQWRSAWHIALIASQWCVEWNIVCC